MDWYYAREGQRQGPMPEARLRELIASGEVRAGDLIWRPGFEGWRPAGEVSELFPPPSALVEAPAAGTGPSLSMRWVSAYAVIMAIFGGLQLLSLLTQLGGRHGRMPLGLALVPLFQWIPAMLSIPVAWGLAQRRRWAWQVNFWLYLVAPLVVGGLIFVAVTIGFVFVESKWHPMGIGIAPAVLLFAFALALFALWPTLNLVYFKKRRHLFTA